MPRSRGAYMPVRPNLGVPICPYVLNLGVPICPYVLI